MNNTHLKNYAIIIKWQTLRMKTTLPFFVVLQIMIGIGATIGISFFMPVKSVQLTSYVATGVPTLTLITIGMTLLPQLIADDKDKGIFDYIWSLPISRVCYLFADLTVWVITAIPGVIVSLIVGKLYYGLTFNVSILIVPTYLLVALCSCFIGYSIAHLLKNSQITLLVCNFLIFSLFLFSPIAYSINQLPMWLEKLHRCLPIIYMADLVRKHLLGVGELNKQTSYLVVGIWTVVCLISTVYVINRKR